MMFDTNPVLKFDEIQYQKRFEDSYLDGIVNPCSNSIGNMFKFPLKDDFVEKVCYSLSMIVAQCAAVKSLCCVISEAPHL